MVLVLNANAQTKTSCLTRIEGAVSDINGIVNSGNVSLLQKIADSTKMQVFATTAIDNFGNYLFDCLCIPSGDYTILAEGDGILYPKDIPTYYGNTHRWDLSTIFNTVCIDTIYFKNITLIDVPVWTDSGFCSGKITYGLKNKTGKYGGETGVFLGGPVPGLDITIESNPGGEVQQHTTTSDSGEFSFGNIPLTSWGYKLFVDVPGLTMDATHDVIMITATDSINGLNFFVDTTSGSGVIFITSTPTSIRDIMIQTSYSVKVFPNPFSDATKFKIEGASEGEIFRLEIADITGRNVKLTDNISATTQLNKGDLAQGLYIYKVLNVEGLIGLGKLVVQ